MWLDGKTVNHALTNAVPAPHRIERESPITLMKAVKNAAELAGMRACHLRDGAAVAEFFAWLEEELPRRGGSGGGAEAITEVELDERVTASRAALSPGTFLEPSFPTIAGVNSNGAIVHYRAVVETAKALSPGGDLVLLDSGGQYTDGTASPATHSTHRNWQSAPAA